MDEEKINISFTDFELVSINMMKELRKDKDFTDVTLVTSDGRRQLKAHRIILSSASSIFNSIFLQHKHQNPLIYLHDIQLGLLEQILEFIYTGRCELHQDDLKMFLDCGTALGIQRLAECVETKDETENTFKVETKKTVFESDPDVNRGTIIALEKFVVEDNSQNMEHSQMNAVDLEQIKTRVSKENTNELEKVEYIQRGTAQEPQQIKTNGSGDKTLSVPNYSSENKPEGVIIPCKSCEQTFASRISLRRHMRKHRRVTHRREKRFGCTICDYKTNRPCQLKDHEDGHAGKVFKCNKCDSVAKNRECLKSHIKIMHGAPFSCTQCEFKSQFRVSMNNHRETMHEDNTYKCDQCAFDTRTKLSLKRHKTRVHSTGARKKCKMCNYSSKHTLSLKWHQQSVHEGLKFKCDKCDKTFNNPQSLKVHKKAHHNQKLEYSCNECEFTTISSFKVSLSRHAEQAHGTKEHMCEKCSYKTKVENDLKIHINREHLELYHFQCEQCSYSSKQKTHLVIHTKSKHEGESLMCNLCNYKASQSSNLKRHQNTKHTQAKGKKAILLPRSSTQPTGN